jgi:hypothetical protein
MAPAITMMTAIDEAKIRRRYYRRKNYGAYQKDPLRGGAGLYVAGTLPALDELARFVVPDCRLSSPSTPIG